MKDKKYALQDFDFVHLAKQSRDAKEKQRLLILANLQDGKTQAVIADTLKVSKDSVKRTLKRFKQSGVSDLKDRPRPGAPSKLEASQHEAVKAFILAQQQDRKGGRLTGYDIQALLEENWQVSYSLAAIYVLLNKLGLSWISSRSCHPKQDKQVQEAFKKTLLKPF